MVTQLTVMAATVLAFVGSYMIHRIDGQGTASFQVIGGAFVTVFWGAIAFWWTDYEIQKQLCCVVHAENQAMSLLALLAGLVMLLDVVLKTFSLISESSP